MFTEITFEYFTNLMEYTNLQIQKLTISQTLNTKKVSVIVTLKTKRKNNKFSERVVIYHLQGTTISYDIFLI